jgi:hypothetical protein
VSPYFENYVQTASGEKLAQKQFKASADFWRKADNIVTFWGGA